MRHLLQDPRFVLAAAGVAVVILGGLLYSLFHRPEDPDETERKRRLHLNQIGRIAEGQVVELVDQPAEPAKKRGGGLLSRGRPVAAALGRKLVWYSYSISGVTYQTAQDITGLDSQIRFDRLAAGQLASIKYDPSNPSDSILVADDWSGLR